MKQLNKSGENKMKWKVNFFNENNEFRFIVVEANNEDEAEAIAEMEANKRDWPMGFKILDAFEVLDAEKIDESQTELKSLINICDNFCRACLMKSSDPSKKYQKNIKNSDKNIIESLTKASHDMGFVCDSMRETLNQAGSVESIIILDLIGKADALKRDVEELLNAFESKNDDI